VDVNSLISSQTSSTICTNWTRCGLQESSAH